MGNNPILEHTREDLACSWVEGCSVPTYVEIFRAPKKCLRDDNKIYGRDLFEKHGFKKQHALLLYNDREVHDWFCGIQIPVDLRHKKKEQDKIKERFSANHHKIKSMEFDDVATYRWQVQDIYRWLISSEHSKRKYKSKKVRFFITLRLVLLCKES